MNKVYVVESSSCPAEGIDSYSLFKSKIKAIKYLEKVAKGEDYTLQNSTNTEIEYGDDFAYIKMYEYTLKD